MSTALILRYLYPDARPGPSAWGGDYTLMPDGSIGEWRVRDVQGRPVPPSTPEHLAAVAASAEYQEWLRTHGGDPAATLHREACEAAGLREAVPVATRALGELVRLGFAGDRQVLAALAASLDEVRAHAGLPPSGIVVPPGLTAEQGLQAMAQQVALLLGLPPVAYEGE